MTAPVAPPPHTHTDARTDSTPRPDHAPLVQRLLLAAGAFCVLVAGSVYLAVSWRTIGVTGQASIALAVTALAALAADLLIRRGLRASGETFAVVAAGLLALDLAGAHRLDVAGVGRLPWWTWLTIATGVVLVVTAALAVLDRLSTYRAVAVAALAFLPWTGLQAVHAAGVDPGRGATTVAALVLAAGLGGLSFLLARRDAVATGVAAVGSAGWWFVAVGTGVAAAVSSHVVTVAVPAAVAWGAVSGALLWATGRIVAAGRTADDVSLCASMLAPMLAAPGVLVVGLAAVRVGPVAAIACSVAVLGLTALPWSSTRAGRPAAVGALALAALLPWLLLLDGRGTDLAGASTLLVAASCLALTARSSAVVAGFTASAAVLATLLGVALIAVGRDQTGLWLSVGWTVVAVALTSASAFLTWNRVLLMTFAVVTSGAAVLAGFATQVLDGSSPALVAALVGIGGARLAHGAARTSAGHVLVGAGALAAAAIDLAGSHDVHAVEAYTLPVAAVALLAGVLGRVRRPELSSWAWIAPGVVVALLPSTVAALADSGVTRLVATAAVAAALTVTGARMRWAAPLVIGAVTEAVLAVSQLAPYAVGAPRWITLAAAGVVLLGLGVLFERARRSARTAGRWYATLG